ncbi:MAG: hypothetical protein QOD75_2763 [Blastocatellia bacterium]|jgi:hypothetical protein|nr:hypothetical protein [Blastocatellia bacterium]
MIEKGRLEDDGIGHSRLAAAQCGKAQPFRFTSYPDPRLRLRVEAQPPEIRELLTVRQSLTALCGGEAASGAAAEPQYRRRKTWRVNDGQDF